MLECLMAAMAAMAALLMVVAIYTLAKDVLQKRDELLAPPTPDYKLAPTAEPEVGSNYIWNVWRMVSSHYSSECDDDDESLSLEMDRLRIC